MRPRQDFYEISADLPLGSGTAAYIDAKFDAVIAHLTNATRTDLNPDQLYISFASAAFIDDNPAVTPKVCAVLWQWIAQNLISSKDFCDRERDITSGNGAETSSLAAGPQRTEVWDH